MLFVKRWSSIVYAFTKRWFYFKWCAWGRGCVSTWVPVSRRPEKHRINCLGAALHECPVRASTQSSLQSWLRMLCVSYYKVSMKKRLAFVENFKVLCWFCSLQKMCFSCSSLSYRNTHYQNNLSVIIFKNKSIESHNLSFKGMSESTRPFDFWHGNAMWYMVCLK